tara:strand:+ start:349 stop:732 length:384 start_codon:yes stop_codon:yes gene_type:complete
MNIEWVLVLLKRHWKELAIIVLSIMVFGKMRMDYNRLEETYDTLHESMQEQIATLKEIHAKELEARDKALKDYEEKMTVIEKNYQYNKRELKKLKEKKEVEHTQHFVDDPDKLIKDINTIFGFEYVE